MIQLSSYARNTRLLDARDFDTQLCCERELADRHSDSFSLLRIDVARRSTRSRVMDVVRSRKRMADVLGEYDGTLGLLLRRTDAEGARELASKLAKAFEAEGLVVSLTVLVYPDPYKGRERGEMPGTPAPRARNTPESDLAPVGMGPTLLANVGLGRRIVDVLVSGAMLLVLAPLLLAVSVAIRLDSRGRVIFAQERVGLGGKPFTLLKFRSMHEDADRQKAALCDQNEHDGPIFKMKDDPRITRVGKWIRRLSLDELPQLWNVLRGDMTLVGPRPPLPDEVADYTPWQRRRLEIAGGLTCIWQVSGRSEVGFDEWMRMDCRYHQRRNFLLDVELLARTIPALLSSRGAY